MPVSRTMWLRGIRADAATMKAGAGDERKARVAEITRKWRDGFRALKEENDRLQRENEETYRREIAEIDRMTAAQIAQGPPA